MPVSTPNTSQGRVEVDALVVGAGAAGMTAALVASLEGLDVLLCEKSDRVGGTTATSAGTIWVPGTRQSREAGFTDNVADARTFIEGRPAADEAGARLKNLFLTRDVVA